MRHLGLLPLGIAVLSLAGCAGGGYYYASTPPPAVRVEARGFAPGPGYVWINGYWGYRGGSHVWVAGRWERPPHARARWIEPRWERRGNRYAFREGRWR